MKSYVLKLTCAIAIDGQIHKQGSLVEVSEAEAKNFLHRGKAVLATEEDGVELQEEQTGTDYSSWTKPAMLEYAKTRGLEVASGMTKDQIIDVIEAAPAAGDDTDQKGDE
ncbi:hypothetical protein RF663_04390 [Aeromonas veronii]|uniref:hypothetical protein n=1 Tax=Aeromonas veronii TaxID=654 RepID=UPI002853670B|nr:hypothetical protein [Aeromonas veronii]MDR5013487.1 hypothetical protein [Aeromonas veronii]